MNLICGEFVMVLCQAIGNNKRVGGKISDELDIRSFKNDSSPI